MNIYWSKKDILLKLKQMEIKCSDTELNMFIETKMLSKISEDLFADNDVAKLINQLKGIEIKDSLLTKLIKKVNSFLCKNKTS